MDIKHIYIPSVYTNCFLLADESSGAAAVIDPGDDVTDSVLRLCTDNGWQLRCVFLTHGHFDHIGACPPSSGRCPICRRIFTPGTPTAPFPCRTPPGSIT